jgi:hypothetical protein
MTPAALAPLAELAPDLQGAGGWRYAAWIAVDVRLLLFVIAIVALASAGTAALIVRSGRVRDLAATFFLAFLVLMPLTVLVFNEVAQHPVFVVESFFAFP